MAKRQSARKMAGDDAKRIISASAFTALIKNLKAAEAEKNSSVGEMGHYVKDAIEKHNVNRKALSWYRAAERMDDTKLRDLLEQFEHYCDVGGLNTRAHAQDEMFDAEERGTVEPAPTTFAEKLASSRKGNGAPTRKPRRAKKPTAEEVAAIADRAERNEGEELH